jgi:pimeloyl-ACP methyl ester carboxylesterase
MDGQSAIDSRQLGNSTRFYRSEDDLRLAYRDYGDPASTRLPVLCLTGLTRNAHDYERLARRLAPERRVICPDYRGRGRSQYDPDWRNYRPETYLNDIRHLLAVLGLERVVVIGTSLGGVLAMGMAALMPRVLAGVVLNDIGPEVDASGLGRILSYVAVDRPQPDWRSASAHLRELLPTLGLETEEDWEWIARGTYREGAADGLLHFDWDVSLAKPLLAGQDTPDLWPFFRALAPVPLLALRGGVSDILTEACFDRMAAERPDMSRAVIPGVGHAPTFDEPASREALARFLAKV